MVLVISSEFPYPQLLHEIKLKSHGVFWKETVGLIPWRPLLYLCSWAQSPLSFMREGPEKVGKDKKRVEKMKGQHHEWVVFTEQMTQDSGTRVGWGEDAEMQKRP